MPISSQDVNVVNIPDVVVDSGNINVVNFPATQPVSGSVSVSNFPATQNVAVTNTVNVVTAQASTSTVAQVIVPLNTNTTLVAANANRKSVIMFVPSQPFYIKFGAVASATSFTYPILVTNSLVTITGWPGIIDGFGKNQTITYTELI